MAAFSRRNLLGCTEGGRVVEPKCAIFERDEIGKSLQHRFGESGMSENGVYSQ